MRRAQANPGPKAAHKARFMGERRGVVEDGRHFAPGSMQATPKETGLGFCRRYTVRRYWWVVIASLMGALVSVALAVPASAADKAAAMVIDANTGRVLHDKAGSEPRYPASLTKMMTLYLAFEAIEAGRLQFSTPIPVSERAAAAAPSKLGLDSGSEIALRDAIKALIVKSANDMAIAIAEKISGSEEAFARLMTKRARQIGMRDTTFRNASGLPNPEQLTTARDMLTLAMRMQDDFPQHYRLFSTRSFSYGGKTYRTHNALLGRFPGVDGIKTGYTRASGFNLVSSYKAGGKYVVGAVFGGASAGVRDAHMRMLLARGIEKASTERTRKSTPQLIAEAKPAERPSVNTIKKQSPPAAPKPAPVSVALEEPSTATNVPAASVEQPERAAPKIDIAKVKTVSVLASASSEDNTQTNSLPVQESAAPPAVSQGSAPLTFATMTARPDFAALKAQLAARVGSEPTDAEAGRTSFAPASIAPLADMPARESETVVAKPESLGRPPSTLQAQLASFAGEESLQPNTVGAGADKPALQAAVADLPAPMPVRVSTGTSRDLPRNNSPVSVSAPSRVEPGFHVQIGVYRSTSDAERAMAAAKSKAGHVLAASSPVAMPITKGEKQLYRARFAGFDSASAASACNELRRNGLDCFVARAN
jgi:D-alanyl-D-alanine carboxypeptidase